MFEKILKGIGWYKALVPGSSAPPETPGVGEIDSTDVGTMVVIPAVLGDYEGALKSVYSAYAQVVGEIAVGFDDFSNRFANALVSDDVKPLHAPVAAGRVGLVQLGDIVGNGPDSEKCVKLFLAIPKVLGWRAWGLFGQSEVEALTSASPLNVHKADTKSYGSRKARAAAYGNFGGVKSCADMTKGEFGPTDCSMYKLLIDHMLGAVRWGETLFVHGGPDLEWLHQVLGSTTFGGLRSVDIDVAKLNSKVHDLLASARDHRLARPDTSDLVKSQYSIFANSSTWFLSDMSTHLCGVVVPKLLKAYHVDRIVMSLPASAGWRDVGTRCDGHLVLVKGAISRWSRGPEETPYNLFHPEALVMRADMSGQLESMVAITDTREELYYRAFTEWKPQRGPGFLSRLVGRGKQQPAANAAAVIVGPSIHPQRERSSPAMRECVVGNQVGIAVHSTLVAITDGISRLSKGFCSTVTLMNGNDFGSPFAPDNALFVSGKCQTLLSAEWLFVHRTSEDDTEYRAQLKRDVYDIMSYAHKHKLLLGFTVWTNVFDYFCVSPGSGRVFLVYWDQVRPSNSPKEIEAEQKLMKKMLYAPPKLIIPRF